MYRVIMKQKAVFKSVKMNGLYASFIRVSSLVATSVLLTVRLNHSLRTPDISESKKKPFIIFSYSLASIIPVTIGLTL